jgi:hypothetical protein
MRSQKTEMISEEAGKIIHMLESLARAGKQGKAGRESRESREKASRESNEKIGSGDHFLKSPEGSDITICTFITFYPSLSTFLALPPT